MVFFNQDNFIQYVESQKLHKTSRVESDVNVYTYNHCDENSETQLKYSRSVIYNSLKNKVVSVAFPYTLELTDVDNFKFNNNWVFTNSYEGSIVQVYYDDEWKVSTMKKVDAYKSRWGGKDTFGELFDKALSTKFQNVEEFYNLLDKELTYTFLIPSNHTSRFVCLPQSEELIYTGSFDKNGHYCYTNVLPNIETVKYNTLENVYSSVKQTNIDNYQGLFGYNSETGDFAKIYNSNYLNAKLLRGNESDLRRRYLQTMRDEELHRRFRTHFFDHHRLFRRLDGSVHAFVKDIVNNTMKDYDADFVNYVSQNDSVNKNHKHVFNYISNLNIDIIWKSVIGRLQQNRQQQTVA